ncbi:MAG: PD40 domain-containing protein [Candidatus Eremiobacteraeota bacterium]|nr:PD40 domain-containing protein [Candidatus Eremiobacteraeota bacterium]
MSLTWKKLVLLAVVSLLTFACDNSEDYVHLGSTPQNQIPTFDLTVQADPAALARADILAQFGSEVTQLRISLYGLGTVEIGEQTVPRTGSAVFSVPAGLYLVRLVGLRSDGSTFGYFDRVIVLSTDETTLIPGLRISASPPAPDLAATQIAPPFFIFTSAPASVVALDEFSVTARIFRGDGYAATSVTTGVGLAASPIAFATAPTTRDTDAGGSVTFDGLLFPGTSDGTTTLTVSAAGVESASTTAVTVVPPFFTTLERSSVGSGGAQSNGHSFQPEISGDGNRIVFVSEATNLVANDSNGFADIYVRDRTAGTTRRVSVDSSGNQADNESFEPCISEDGNHVGFGSRAGNLVSGDSANDDVFLYNLLTGVIISPTVAVGADDFSRAPSLSADGNLMSFDGNATNLGGGGSSGDVFVFNGAGNTIQTLTAANQDSLYTAIAANGSAVAFRSSATDLVVGADNGNQQIFVYDLNQSVVEHVSKSSTGVQADGNCSDPDISGDGRFVTFASGATTLVANDTNGLDDVFVHDRTTDTTERVSMTGATQGNGDSFGPSISGDGRFVVFSSVSDNLVAGDTNGAIDIFVIDRNSGEVRRISLTKTGEQANGNSFDPTISGDGRFVCFKSEADNLVVGDSNGFDDLFTVANPFLY